MTVASYCQFIKFGAVAAKLLSESTKLYRLKYTPIVLSAPNRLFIIGHAINYCNLSFILESIVC